jgi:hypothetical protein
MPSWLENLGRTIDDTWNGRLTQQGGQQPNSPAAKWDKMFGGGGQQNSGFDFGRDVYEPFSKAIYDPERTNRANEALSRRAGIAPTPTGSGTPLRAGGMSDSMRMLQNLNSRNQTTMDSPVDEMELSPEEQQIEDTIRAIQERLQGTYVDDGSYNAMIDEAYGGALSAIGNARTKAQGNYQESDRVLEQLTQGHVNAINGEDMDAIKRTGQTHQADTKAIYDSAISGEQADRQKVIDQRAEAISRYGLQESGMGTAGEVQSGAIEDFNASSADAQNSARVTQAANESMNVARAQSQAGEGVERRSSLRRDLDNILGDLDQSQATVESQKATARLSAKQADMAAFNESQARDTDTLEMYLRNKLDEKKMRQESQQKTKGSASSFDVAAQRFSSQGIDPAPYLDAYSSVVADNSYSSASGQDKIAAYVAGMMKKNKNLSRAQALQWVSMIENYGTDKLTGTG